MNPPILNARNKSKYPPAHCNFDVYKAAGLFDLPDNLEPAVLVSIGYSASETIRE